MLYKKKNTFQITIIAFLIISVQLVLSAVFLMDYNNQIKENYNLAMTDNIDNISYSAENILSYYESIASNQSPDITAQTEIPDGFSGIGFIKETKTSDNNFHDLKIKVEDEGFFEKSPEKTIKVSAATYGRMKADGVYRASLDELTGEDIISTNKLSYELFVYALSDGSGVIILLKPYGSMIEQLNSYGFDTINCYFMHGETTFSRTLLSGASAVENGTLTELERIFGEGTTYAYIGNSFYAYSLIDGYNLSILGSVNETTLQRSLNSMMLKILMILGVFLIFGIIFAVSAIIFYTRKYNNILFYNGKNMSNFVLKTNRYGQIKYANETFKRNFNADNIFDHAFNDFGNTTEKLAKAEPLIIKLTDKNESDRYLTLLNSSGVNTYKFVGGDMTEFVNIYNAAHEQNFTDTVTKLNNEIILKKDFEATTNARREIKSILGLLDPINLPEFQVMSGKYFADQILRTLGEKLTNVFKEYGKVYYDGERYCVLTNADASTTLQEKLPEIIQRLNTPMSVGNNLILLKIKAGFTIMDKHTEEWTYSAIKDNASAALKRAIKTNDTAYFVFHQLQSKHYVGYKTFDIPVAELIANDAIDVFYQPQLNIKSRKVSGFEALCRLKGGFMQDMNIQQFIEMVERRGEMIELGDFIYEKSLAFAKEVEKYDATVSLNVSPIQMLQSGFADKIIKKFKAHNIKDDIVNIEVTETFLMTSFDDISPKLDELRRHGIGVHLDDFGVEYSSFLYLKKLPISVIKIDREFIKDIETDKYSYVIVDNMINIAKKLSMKCIAEGVEYESQLKLLKDMGCDEIQGFYVSQAVSRDRALAILIEYLEKAGAKNEPAAAPTAEEPAKPVGAPKASPKPAAPKGYSVTNAENKSPAENK